MAETITTSTCNFGKIQDELGLKSIYSDSSCETDTPVVTESTDEVQYTDITETPAACTVKPIEAFMSTNLNNRNNTYDDIAERILYRFGYPRVSVSDLHRDQIYDAIATACELYTQYAGFTNEYMALDSRLYVPNKGIRIDQLYTIASLEVQDDKEHIQRVTSRNIDQMKEVPNDIYVTKVEIPKDAYYISDSDYKTLLNNCQDNDKDLINFLYEMSKKWPNGIEEADIIPGKLYEFLVLRRGYDQTQFKKSKDKTLSFGGVQKTIYAEDESLGRVRDKLATRQSFDYDLMDYRKVAAVRDWVEGASTSMTSLFSFEAALATQTYFTYQFSLRGFDMVSWYSMHEWRKTREKMLGTIRDVRFDPYTQWLTFSPQPKPEQHFCGVIDCYVERPLKDILKSQWVFEYALAICKEIVGRIRSKWGDSTSLLGTSGSLTGNALCTEGLNEQKELKTMLIEKHGYGECTPTRFIIG